MIALVGAFNQEKALVGAFSVIVQPVVEPMDRFAALVLSFYFLTSKNVRLQTALKGFVQGRSVIIASASNYWTRLLERKNNFPVK